MLAAELLIGAALLAGYGTALAAATGLLLLTVFTAAAASAVVRGLSGMPCGCFGLGRASRIGPNLFARNLLLAAALLVCLVHNRPWAVAVFALSSGGAAAIVLGGRRRAAQRRAPGHGPAPCRTCGPPVRLERHARAPGTHADGFSSGPIANPPSTTASERR